MKSKNVSKKLLFLTRAAIISGMYVVLTLLSGLLGLDGKGIIQVRISEALCVLPIFTSAAIPGVTIGCFIYNLLFANPIDAVFGTLATLLGVLSVHFIKPLKRHPALASIPTVVSNTLIIPFIIAFVYSDGGFAAVPFLMLTVFIGEIISCTVLGTLLYFVLKKHSNILFGAKK